jgi:hypothetical protein
MEYTAYKLRWFSRKQFKSMHLQLQLQSYSYYNFSTTS